MNKNPQGRHGIRWILVVVCVAALALGAVELFKDTDTTGEASGKAAKSEPAEVRHVPGTSLSRVTLSLSAIRRLDLQTTRVLERRVRIDGRRRLRTVVPYSAVLYDERGKTWVYKSPSRFTFVRARVTVDRIRDSRAVLSAGPPAGTVVASVGVAELYGTELGVAGE